MSRNDGDDHYIYNGWGRSWCKAIIFIEKNVPNQNVPQINWKSKKSHIQLIPFCVCRCHEKTLQIHGRVWKVVVEVNLWPWEPHRMCRGYRGRMKNSLIQLVPTDSTRPFFVFANLWPWEPRIRCRGDKGRMKNSLIELVPYDSTPPFFVFANAMKSRCWSQPVAMRAPQNVQRRQRPENIRITQRQPCLQI